uniref:Retrotransposon gag domain-containing protein n=1 Tax=Fagus sylvatica TaxID=28930 RepID=A0A2N9FIZ8_FAGSY
MEPKRRKARRISDGVKAYFFVDNIHYVIFAFAIKWLGETSGPGPSEQEIRMVALERKFDELLSFVQLIAKRNTEDENQRKEDDKDTSSYRALNSFGKHRTFSSMSWFPNMTVPPKFKAPEFEKYNGRGDPMIHLQMECSRVVLTVEEDLSLEGTGRIPSLAQYGFNSQIAPDRFDPSEGWRKKSNETFREYAQRWREKAARARPPLDEREMIKIFVDTLKNPYFDRMIGITNAVLCRPDTGLLQTPAPTQAPAPAPAPQMPARPEGNQPNDNSLKDYPTSPPTLCLNIPEGGVNMVEIEEGNEESIAWRRLFYTLEKQKHITPLDAPPGPSTGDSCEYHSGARGHSLDCCEEFKKKVTDLMEKWDSGERRNTIKREAVNQMTPPISTEADWGYFMEDDTDEWRDVDFTEFFQFPCLIVPPGFVTPEFEIFYEDGDPEVHLQKYGEKMALHLENELLMISVFPESLSKQAAAWFYQLRNLTGWDDFGKTLTEGEEEEKAKPLPPAKEPDNITIAEEGEEPIKTLPSNVTTTAEEEYAGPMVEGLSIHTITGEEDSTTTPPTVITPFFTHGIFSDVGTQDGTTRTEPAWSDEASPHQTHLRRRSETHFPSYRTQLSDRQELLRSSRNLSQKMTPWHKEHSDGLRSQDHILRTQARLCARPVPLENRVFLTRNKLIREPGHVRKEDTFMHDVELSDRQDFIRSSRNPDRKTALKRTKNTPVASVRGYISQVQARISASPNLAKSEATQAFRRYQERRNLTSGARSNMCANWDKI